MLLSDLNDLDQTDVIAYSSVKDDQNSNWTDEQRVRGDARLLTEMRSLLLHTRNIK